MERYYEKRAIKNGSIRHCEKCKIKLSRYNYDKYCSVCTNSKENDNRKKLMEMLNAFK
jgi:uncharacterized Zn finger protein (UPF0148 family)